MSRSVICTLLFAAAASLSAGCGASPLTSPNHDPVPCGSTTCTDPNWCVVVQSADAGCVQDAGCQVQYICQPSGPCPGSISALHCFDACRGTNGAGQIDFAHRTVTCAVP